MFGCRSRALVRLPQREMAYMPSLFRCLSVDPNGAIGLEVYRNLSVNAGQNSPYVQRLNLMGYLQ